MIEQPGKKYAKMWCLRACARAVLSEPWPPGLVRDESDAWLVPVLLKRRVIIDRIRYVTEQLHTCTCTHLTCSYTCVLRMCIATPSSPEMRPEKQLKPTDVCPQGNFLLTTGY